MNIKEAKEQIQNAMRAYFTKDEYGNYMIPIERQRPIFLMGPPGIGKTAIMEQISAELGVGLVSYSMTHHTRQSALGLPFIEKKTFGGVEYSVSEYTMSEIIASVYDMMEKTGLKEGILFLDEINCVSETLAPSMLQFLQYKIFGRHRVPNGWIVVTAGNPPEYNNSVRDFDIVTWDRLKRIDVTPNLDVWKEYASNRGIHRSIITYLSNKPESFYKIETTVDGKTFVTARGWTDLSDMMKLYEQLGIEIDESLILQYLQNKKIAKEFSLYYDLFKKYRSDYQVDLILDGIETHAIFEKVKKAGVDERLALTGLLVDGVVEKLRAVYMNDLIRLELLKSLNDVKTALGFPSVTALSALGAQIGKLEQRVETGKHSSSLSHDNEYALRGTIAALQEMQRTQNQMNLSDNKQALLQMKKDFDQRTEKMRGQAENAKSKLSNAFRFCETAFESGTEMLILVTELTNNDYSAHFIGRYGCEEYSRYSKKLRFYERRRNILAQIEDLSLNITD